MRRAKRAAPPDGPILEFSGEALDHREFKRLLRIEHGQQTRQARCEHGLACSWRTQHQEIVTARSRNFEGSLDVVLAFDFIEVRFVGAVRIEEGAAVEMKGEDVDFAFKKIPRVLQTADRIDRNAIDHRRFRCVRFRHQQSVPAAAFRLKRDGK